MSRIKYLNDAVKAGKIGRARRAAKRLKTAYEITSAGVTVVADGLGSANSNVSSAAAVALANLRSPTD